MANSRDGPRAVAKAEGSVEGGEARVVDLDDASTGPEEELPNRENNDTSQNQLDLPAPAPSPFMAEPSLLLKLSGRNEANYVEVEGWTRSIPIGFPGIRNDLKMKIGVIPDGMSPESYIQEVQGCAESLKDLANFQEKFYRPVQCPLVFQIVAKRTPVVIFSKPSNNQNVSVNSNQNVPAQVFVIGQAIVADDSGACLLTCWNEATHLFLEPLQIGDFVLCLKSHCKESIVKNFKFKQPFHSKLLDIELKIDKYDVRGITVIPRSMIRSLNFRKLRPVLFDSEPVTFLPSDLVNAEGRLQFPVDPVAESETSQDKPSEFFNVMGVVSSISRIVRSQSINMASRVQCVEKPAIGDGDTGSELMQLQSIHQYYVCRFLTIIDVKSSPVTVKLYLNQNTKRLFEKLVPGSLIILTCCQLGKSGVFHYITVSVFTEIFVNEGYIKYFRVLHFPEIKRFENFFKLKCFTDIYNRSDIRWSLGGLFPIQLTDPDKLHTYFSENEKKIRPEKVFTRREYLSTVIKAKIIAVYVISDESCQYHVPKPFILHKMLFERSLTDVDLNGYRAFSDSSHCRCSKCYEFHWQATTWELPKPIIPSTENLSVMQLLKNCVQQNAEICSSLSLPVEKMPVPDEGVAKIKENPKLHDRPAYLVCLVDKTEETIYHAVWKGLPKDVMRSKLRHVKEGEYDVLAFLEVFCYESEGKHGLEINLKDFVEAKTEEVTPIVLQN